MTTTKNASLPVPDSGAKAPAHETVYQTLRGQILFGELAPGQAVTIQGLTEALNVGMTPVREAIRRLISDGALVFQGNRRVSVPVLRLEDLDELSYARKTIECELARRATLRITAEHIAVLTRIDDALDRAISAGDVAGYLAQNYAFHTALYQHARAPILTDLADRMWLRFGPSLRVVCGRLGTQSFPDRHKDILDALRKADPELAALAMERDVMQGMEQVSQGIAAVS
ncbi:GntR family transcriptional regulator [Parasedimentitalea psychrophila]|uniref:GntR family transcriptional regulator n=1 Tax=Parasedimentitalea psychrophila TaxID=2997337 RepID=A0A9Y2P2J7_9RHOB|nr:GntR family transcriptional regulator [Parasedimentitalea psychrophila]WIY26731.1 GntR family transcriptional regulator [Parasedimentitalea psychrophila]